VKEHFFMLVLFLGRDVCTSYVVLFALIGFIHYTFCKMFASSQGLEFLLLVASFYSVCPKLVFSTDSWLV